MGKLFLEGSGINILVFAGQSLSQIVNSAIVFKGVQRSLYAQVLVCGGISSPQYENLSSIYLSLWLVNFKKPSYFAMCSFISHKNLVQPAEQQHT